MSTRLVPRIGLIPAEERAGDSRDEVRFHEPAVGAPARTKGNLYLLAQVTGGEAAARGAHQALDAIEHDYYYDLSAGPIGALTHALEAANRRLFHERQRLGIGRGAGIAVVAAVVRDRHLHLATIGVAAAVIIRGGRMFELPPPPDPAVSPAGVPTRRRAASLGEVHLVTADAWEGELAAGDRVALVSRHLASVLGADTVRQALVEGDPAHAAAAAARAFHAAGGAGSDGLVVIDIGEQASTETTRRLEPVWPEDRLAGLRDRGPIPVADTVGGAFRRADAAVDGLQARTSRGMRQSFARLGALVPHRSIPYPGEIVRTEAVAARRRRRRGFLGMAGIAVAVSLGVLVASLPGVSPTEAIPRLVVARESILRTQEILAAVDTRVDGQDLVERDPSRAEELLSEGVRQLARAAGAGVSDEQLGGLQSRVEGKIDTLFLVGRIREFTTVADLASAYDGFDPTRMVGASDGSLWVLDGGRGRIIRVDPLTGASEVLLRAGTEVGGVTPGEPWLMATAATDVVVLDRDRQAWRTDLVERIPRRMALNGIETLDSRSTLLAALQHRPPLEIFNLYLVDGADGQIRKWSPSSTLPVAFPNPSEPFLTSAPDLDPRTARDLLVDANVWLLHARTVTRVNFGTPLDQSDYSLDAPPDASVRDALDYTLLDALAVGDLDEFLVYDGGNARILAFQRADGAFIRQWLAPTDGAAAGLLDQVVGMVVPSVVDGPPVAYLLTPDRIVRVVLE